MKLNLQALAKDRRVQVAGVAGAAALGGFAWYRNKKSGASSSSSTSADGSDSTTPAAYAPGTFPDTTQTDTAAWLGQNEAAFVTELQQYQQSLTTGTPAPGTTPSPVSPTPAAGPVPHGGSAKFGGPITINPPAVRTANLSSRIGAALGRTPAVAAPDAVKLSASTITPGSSLRL